MPGENTVHQPPIMVNPVKFEENPKPAQDLVSDSNSRDMGFITIVSNLVTINQQVHKIASFQVHHVNYLI